jgi:hypothetical protein
MYKAQVLSSFESATSLIMGYEVFQIQFDFTPVLKTYAIET